MVHHRTAAVGGGGAKRRAVCKNVSHSTDACDRLKLSGIAGHYSGHPIRTRFALSDAAGTVRAVFLWSVERLRHLVGASRSGQPGGLRIVASRWASRGLPDPMPLRALPSLSRRFAECRRWRLAPRCLKWRGDHVTSAFPPTTSVVSTDHVGAPADHVALGLRESAADCRGGGGAGQALSRAGATLRAAGMRGGLCAFRG